MDPHVDRHAGDVDQAAEGDRTVPLVTGHDVGGKWVVGGPFGGFATFIWRLWRRTWQRGV